MMLLPSTGYTSICRLICTLTAMGQALVRQLKIVQPVAGLGPENRVTPVDNGRSYDPRIVNSEAEATWHVRSHVDARLAGIFPEAALWEWRAPSESAGVYPNAPIPAFAPLELSAGQSLALQANHSSLVLDDAPGMATSVHFRSLSLVLAGRPGSVVQICAPAGCAQRDLDGATWTYACLDRREHPIHALGTARPGLCRRHAWLRRSAHRGPHYRRSHSTSAN